LRLGERYGAQRLEDAAQSGLKFGAIHYRNKEIANEIYEAN
jgi:hypothetical protein